MRRGEIVEDEKQISLKSSPQINCKLKFGRKKKHRFDFLQHEFGEWFYKFSKKYSFPR